MVDPFVGLEGFGTSCGLNALKGMRLRSGGFDGSLVLWSVVGGPLGGTNRLVLRVLDGSARQAEHRKAQNTLRRAGCAGAVRSAGRTQSHTPALDIVATSPAPSDK